MRFIAIVALIASTSALAETWVTKTVRFTIPSRDLGTVTYYNCDSVEDAVERNLETLGATNISVRCTGGLDTWNPGWSTDAMVRATFDTIVPTGNGGQERMTVRSSLRTGDCRMNVAILDRVIPAMPSVTLESRQARCSNFGGRDTGRWAYDVTITR
jgi:hypothetical protein